MPCHAAHPVHSNIPLDDSSDHMLGHVCAEPNAPASAFKSCHAPRPVLSNSFVGTDCDLTC